MKQYIKLDPLDVPRKYQKRLTEKEKTTRLYSLAKKLGVKIGDDSRRV